MTIRFCAGLLLALTLTALVAPGVRAADGAPLAITADMLTEEVLAANRALAGRRAATAALASEAEAADDLDDPRLMLGTAPNTIGHRVDGRGLIQPRKAGRNFRQVRGVALPVQQGSPPCPPTRSPYPSWPARCRS